MKFSLLFAAVGAAMAPPKISLDLEGMVASTKLATSIYRPHNEGLKQPSGKVVKSRQDWTEKCAAGRPAAECPLPKAKAFDANDKSLTVRTRMFLVDVGGYSLLKEVKKVDFTKRSTYLFKYDATDAAMNHAEQVVFALVLDDQTAPKISVCKKDKQVVEAASSWTLCKSFATDNIDGVVSNNVKYTIDMLPGKTNKVFAVKKLPTKPSTLVKDVTYAQAQRIIDTDVVGKYLLTLKVSDKAGVYGKNSKNNRQVARQAIVVQDTTKPTISMHGAQPAVVECSVRYSDEGAYAADKLDTSALGRKIAVTSKSTVNTKKVGWYNVKYNAADVAGNKAEQAKRRVRVRDTTYPRIYLKGKSEMEVWAGQHKKGGFTSEPGVTTFDLCDKSKMAVTMKWVGVNGEFDDKVPGVYVREYCVVDHMGLKSCITRKVNVSDKTVPQIVIQGEQVATYEASHDITYTDKGAKCTDYVEGDIGHAVEVSGEVVNMARPATYKISYNCQDSTGNAATMLTRTVVIEDTTCPTVSILGANTAYVEAGFPYVDAGATSTDTLDGNLAKKIWTDGNSVDVAMSFIDLRSCREIKKQYPGAKTAEYYVTTWNKVAKKFQRITVWCDMHTSKKSAFTYHAIKGGKRVVPYSGGVQGADIASDGSSCKDYGLGMARFTTKGQKKAAVRKYGKLFFPAKGASSDLYLCSTNDQFNVLNKRKLKKQRKLNRAEVGRYVIAFHVQDKAGNLECKTKFRTVVVKDTLAPVISLKFKNKVVLRKHRAKASYGVGGVRNPAELAKTNPNFMEERSVSVNGWMLAAVASAVTGVALLSMSSKSTVVDV